MKAIIEWDETKQVYAVAFDKRYAPIVEALKQFIPAGARVWDPVAMTWYVTEQYGDAVYKLLVSSWGSHEVHFKSRKQAQQAALALSNGELGKALEELFRLVPYEEAKTLYRKLQLIYHPDRGGDAHKASRVNELWQRIKATLYPQEDKK